MIKLEGFKKTKSLGRLNSSEGVGVSVQVNAEVMSAEYAKDSEGKVKKSKAGNKQIKLNVKVVDEITKDNGEKVNIPSFMNVTYYETDFSPKLKEVKPTDKLQKFVQIKYNVGGLGKDGNAPFGSFKVRNYEGNDGKPKNSVSLFGGNIATPKKMEGTYTIKDFDGADMVFVTDKRIKVKIKGVFEPINDTESFIKTNYDEHYKKLYIDMYYMENDGDADYDTAMPVVLEGIEKDRVMDFIKFVKSNENTIIGLAGAVKTTPIYGETTEDTSGGGFGEYSYGGRETLGYEAGLVVNYHEEKNNWEIMTTSNKGELYLSDTNTVNDLEDSDFDF